MSQRPAITAGTKSLARPMILVSPITASDVTSDGELACHVPPGVGTLSPVTVQRVGGIAGK